MEGLVPLAMFGWIPVVLLIFRDVRGHRAVVICYVMAWLFLPSTTYEVPVLPDYSKMTATSAVILFSSLIFERDRLLSFRARLIDIPMVIFCLSPILTSLANELGLWDGLSAALDMSVVWGMPYFIGRVFFTTHEEMRTLAWGIFVGAVIYIPFCIFEARMSPILYDIVYGFRPRITWNCYRYGGWRPNVFLETGLELGMWMTAASLIGIWMYLQRTVRRFWGLPLSIFVAAVFLNTINCRCTGPILLMFGGIALLLLMRTLKTSLPVILLLLVSPIYIGLRATGAYDGQHIVQLAEMVVGGERAQSLEFRFNNENILRRKALRRPLLGWGRFGRARIYDEWGKDVSVTDGLWIITLGQQGFVGLASLYTVFLTIPFMVLKQIRGAHWRDPKFAPSIALAVVVVLYITDGLLNAMVNPVFALAVGGLSSLCVNIEPIVHWDKKIKVKRQLWPPRNEGPEPSSLTPGWEN